MRFSIPAMLRWPLPVLACEPPILNRAAFLQAKNQNFDGALQRSELINADFGSSNHNRVEPTARPHHVFAARGKSGNGLRCGLGGGNDEPDGLFSHQPNLCGGLLWR